MKILVPFFGDTVRFRPLLAKWIHFYQASGTRAPWFALTNGPQIHEFPTVLAPINGFADLIRPHQAFDVKGALVCAALLHLEGDLLVLDADAFLERDPASMLATLRSHVISMPIDDGALTHGRQARLESPWGKVEKHCAGVMFFPAHAGRSRLVSAYRKAWLELRDHLPWEGRLPHLLEQHAWSLASRRRGGGVLPRVMNWNPDFLGDNPAAVIVHRYGLRKWRD